MTNEIRNSVIVWLINRVILDGILKELLLLGECSFNVSNSSLNNIVAENLTIFLHHSSAQAHLLDFGILLCSFVSL